MEMTFTERAQRIRCVVLDVDGVVTDCKLYLGPDGTEWKAVNVRDGLGIKLLLKAGIEVAVISGRPSEAMRRRFEYLGVRHVWLDVERKIPAFETLLGLLGIDDSQVAVMGDDVPDLPLMRRAGLALTVADAHPKALAAAHWASRLNGGNGAVRDAADLILKAQGKDALAEGAQS
jgi:3-deoxy-D-manno-octulosonate 8-phosphate phosphatase (KDO 8-P phosphatase)